MTKQFNEVVQTIADHHGDFIFIDKAGEAHETTRERMMFKTDYLTSFMHFTYEFCGNVLVIWEQ